MEDEKKPAPTKKDQKNINAKTMKSSKANTFLQQQETANPYN